MGCMYALPCDLRSCTPCITFHQPGKKNKRILTFFIASRHFLENDVVTLSSSFSLALKQMEVLSVVSSSSIPFFLFQSMH